MFFRKKEKIKQKLDTIEKENCELECKFWKDFCELKKSFNKSIECINKDNDNKV